MMSDLMREEFEKGWGYTNEEQDCYFIPEINCYGSERVNRAAEGKSIAWLYFQRGWKASRECLVIELPEPIELEVVGVGCTCHSECLDVEQVEKCIESYGVKIK